jgi:dsDNA-specific endonuclease/ATPase MutS2
VKKEVEATKTTLTEEEFNKLSELLNDYAELAYEQTYENYLADADEYDDYICEEAEEAAREAEEEVGEIVEKLKTGAKLTKREKEIVKHVLSLSGKNLNKKFIDAVYNKLKLGKS